MIPSPPLPRFYIEMLFHLPTPVCVCVCIVQGTRTIEFGPVNRIDKLGLTLTTRGQKATASAETGQKTGAFHKRGSDYKRRKILMHTMNKLSVHMKVGNE